jgi:hypothetical protein
MPGAPIKTHPPRPSRIIDDDTDKAYLPRLPALLRRVPGTGTWYFSWKNLTRHFGWTLDVDGLPAMVFTVGGNEVQTRQGRTIAVLSPCTKIGVTLAKPFVTALQQALDVACGDVLELAHAFTVASGSMRGIMVVDVRVQARLSVGTPKHGKVLCDDHRTPEGTSSKRDLPRPTEYEVARTVSALEIALDGTANRTWMMMPMMPKRLCLQTNT